MANTPVDPEQPAPSSHGNITSPSDERGHVAIDVASLNQAETWVPSSGPSNGVLDSYDRREWEVLDW